MLGAIRKKSKGWVAYLIVGLITVPFALFGIQEYIGGSSNSAVASVDGEDISLTYLLSKTKHPAKKFTRTAWCVLFR